MRTAENIIKEYLEQGYNLAALRSLADTRSEPLRSEMTTILDKLEQFRVPAATTETASQEEAVFFIADDGDTANCEAVVDFNLMAEEVVAEVEAVAEESVAEIFIGETEGADVVGVPEAGIPEDMIEAVATEEAQRDAEPAAMEEMTVEHQHEPEPPVLEETPMANAGMDVMAETASECIPAVAPLAESITDIVPLPSTDPVLSKKESRRERRRRSKAEKKKLKKQQQENAIAAPEMPEIILTRSEGTETLIPEHAEQKMAEISGEEQAAPEPDLHMLPSPSTLDLQPEEQSMDDEEARAQDDTEADAEHYGNVIVFHPQYPMDVLDDDDDEEESPRLRMLTFDVPQDAEEAAPPAVARAELPHHPKEDILSPLIQLSLIKAFAGMPEANGMDESHEEAEHVILTIEPNAPTSSEIAIAEAARAEMEQEYQVRADEFAARLLQSQSVAADGQKLAGERKTALEATESELATLRKSMAATEASRDELQSEVEQAREEDARKQARLTKFGEMRGEHEQLYKEFEDLRLAYNEVVTDVMPALQNERDDLALTVERQCETETTLRTSLGSARKRLTVGYSMGAAACAMLVALPVFNWLRSGSDERELAFDRQRVGELRQQLKKAEVRNLESEKHIFNLERKVDLQLAELQQKNHDLSQTSDKRTMEMAMSRNGGSPANAGTPIRVSDMALAGPMDHNGLLRYNDVRDPAGSIDNQLAMNRALRTNEQTTQPSTSRVAVSSRARTPAAGNTRLRPAQNQNTTPTTKVKTAAVKPESTTAKVKTGEGVAQVVYRVLGTRDPEVINWVIRENSIQKDRRGNPRIYPDQELKLPKGGRLVQSASTR